MKALKYLRTVLALPALALLLGAGSANALTLSFGNISANNVGDAAIGEAQLSVDVTDFGGGQVLFTFNNAGPEASSIADVYFDDGTLLGIAALIDADEGGGDAGVDFSQLATPGNLPAANNASPPFETTAGFSADADPPVQPKGVNPGESLGVIFDLLAGVSFADTLAALDQGGGVGGLRIGIHVQGFASGGSESFVNNPPDGGEEPPSAVPEPGVLSLVGFSLLGMLAVRRRYAFKA